MCSCLGCCRCVHKGDKKADKKADKKSIKGEDATNEQSYRYLTIDEMKSLGDDSLPIDTTREDRYDTTAGVDESISPQHTFSQMNAAPVIDNVDVTRAPVVQTGFLVSFLVDAKGGAMRGCRHSGVRVIVPPQCVTMPTRVTCRYVRRDKPNHPPPPPLMEGEALASRILELGPVGVKFLGPVVIEVPNFAALRGNEREIVILRSDNGETWREHTVDSSNEAVHDILSRSFDKDGNQIQLDEPNRITSIVTHDFPHYFAIVSRIRQEVHAIGPEGGMVSSSVVPQVQAVFPQGALTKKIKVGLQAQPIPSELTAAVLGNCVAVSPIVTIEPRRRKFHKPITLTLPVPQAANKGMINQYSGDAPTLRLLCSITGGTSRAQWEDVTGSTPLTFVKECVSFTTTVSARFWLMDIRDIAVATKKATELYREAIHIPFMAKFVVFAKRIDNNEARLRVFCMTDDKEDKTLESQEHFTEVAKSRDVEVLEGKKQLIELSGNLISVTKSGDQLKLGFNAFQENRLPFTVRIKDSLADPIGRMLFFKEQKPVKTSTPHPPICVLNIVLPDTIIPESDFFDSPIKKYYSLNDSQGYHRSELKFSDISNLIGDDWEALAEKLGIRSSECKVIKIENPESTARQSSVMLKQWHQRAGSKASANILESALLSIGREDIVQECFLNSSISKTKIPNGNGLISHKIEDIHGNKNDHYTTDDDELKYTAEEKIIDDSELKSVSERKMEIEKRLLDEQSNKKEMIRERSESEEKRHMSGKQHSEEREIIKNVVHSDDGETFEPTKLTFQQKRLSFEKGYSVDKILSEGIAKEDGTQITVVEEQQEKSNKKEKSVEKDKPPRKDKVAQKESSEQKEAVKSAQKEPSVDKDAKTASQKPIEKPARKEPSVEKTEAKEIPSKQPVEKPVRKEPSVEKVAQKESVDKIDQQIVSQPQPDKAVSKEPSVEKIDHKPSAPPQKEKPSEQVICEKPAKNEKISSTDESIVKQTKIEEKVIVKTEQKEKSSEEKVTINSAQKETPCGEKITEKAKFAEEKICEKPTPKDKPAEVKSDEKVVQKENSADSKVVEKTVAKVEEKIVEKSTPKLEEKSIEKSPPKVDEKIDKSEQKFPPKEDLAKKQTSQEKPDISTPKTDSFEKDEKILSFQEKRLSFEHPITISQTSEVCKLQKDVKIDNESTHKDTRDKETRDNDTRRDSELFEGVTLGLGKLDAKPIPLEQNFLSPKPVKTPPPSPAEFSKETSDEWHKTDSLDSNKSNRSTTDLETPSSDIQPSPTDSSAGDKQLSNTENDTRLLSRVLENDDTDIEENADYFSKKKFWQSFESAGSEKNVLAPVPRPRASIGGSDEAPVVAKRSTENIRSGFIATKSESLQERCVSDKERSKPSMKKVHSLTAYSTDSEAEYIASCGIEKLAYENVAFSEEDESVSEVVAPQVGSVKAKKLLFEQMQRESSSQESITSPSSSKKDEISSVGKPEVITSQSSLKDEIAVEGKTIIDQSSPKIEASSDVKTTVTTSPSSSLKSEIAAIGKTSIDALSKKDEVSSIEKPEIITSPSSFKNKIAVEGKTIIDQSSKKIEATPDMKTIVTTSPSSTLKDEIVIIGKTTLDTLSKKDEISSVVKPKVITSPLSLKDEIAVEGKTIIDESSKKIDATSDVKTTVTTSLPSSLKDEIDVRGKTTTDVSSKKDETTSTVKTTSIISSPSFKKDEKAFDEKTTIITSHKNGESISTVETVVISGQPSSAKEEISIERKTTTTSTTTSSKKDEILPIVETKITSKEKTTTSTSKKDESPSIIKTTVSSSLSSVDNKTPFVVETKVISSPLSSVKDDTSATIDSLSSSTKDESSIEVKTTVISTSTSCIKDDIPMPIYSSSSSIKDEITSTATIVSSSTKKSEMSSILKTTTPVTQSSSIINEALPSSETKIITDQLSSEKDETVASIKTILTSSPSLSKSDMITTSVTPTIAGPVSKKDEPPILKTTVITQSSSKTNELPLETTVVTSPPLSKTDEVPPVTEPIVSSLPLSTNDETADTTKTKVLSSISSSEKDQIPAVAETTTISSSLTSIKDKTTAVTKSVLSSEKDETANKIKTQLLETETPVTNVDNEESINRIITSIDRSQINEISDKLDEKEESITQAVTTLDDTQTNGTLDESLDNTQSESDITPEDLRDKQFLMQDWESTNEMLENIAQEKDRISIKTVSKEISYTDGEEYKQFSDSRGFSEDNSEVIKEEAQIVAENLINEIEEELGKRPDIVECLLKSKLEELVDEIAATSSNDITDEDLKSTGTEVDIPTYSQDDVNIPTAALDLDSKMKMKISKASPTEYEIKYEQVEEFNILESVDFEEQVIPEETDSSLKSTNESFTVVCKNDLAKPSKIPIRNIKIPHKETELQRKSSEEEKSRTSTSPEYVQDFVEIRQNKSRKSGADFEPCSSSSESHYHSFEHSGTASRPLSSDVEGLLSSTIPGTTGSSEYETAASHDTSHDFHTAMSSASIHESIKSIDSESSGNLGSAEVSSEISETLVASTAELEHDVDLPTSHYYDETKKSVFRRSPIEPYDNDIPMDVIKRGSQSFDMGNLQSFACEQKKMLETSKFGQSGKLEEPYELDDKLLSSTEDMSSFSITDGGSNLQTVVEVNSTESDRMDNSLISEQSLTISATSNQFSTSSSDLKDEAEGDKKVDVGAVGHTHETSVINITPCVTSTCEIQTKTSVTSKIDKSDSKDTISRDISMDDIPNITISHHSTPPKESPVKDSPITPDSESFEMIEQPDEMDDFVIVEEVAKEACEQDGEGKGIRITEKRKPTHYDDEVRNLPQKTSSTLTKVEYYGGNDGCSFPIEGVPNEEKPTIDEEYENSPPNDNELYEHEVEEGKKWIEMQFQADSEDASSYEYNYERVPLEDIKEEDTDEMHSSKIGSVSSQISQSIGSLGSMKQSLSSTPDYDILAGKRYFTKSSDKDDISQGSLQEFERLEQLMALESMKSKLSGSQDSLGSSVNGKKRSGDDISISSLKEFEGLEYACVEAEKIEERALAEERLLSQIEEGHESQASESESCETLEKSCYAESDDDDDYDQKMFEIDEIIRQAQSNVEKFIDVDRLEKTESLGRGDSFEETARIPDFELDQPLTENTHSSSEIYSGKKYIEHFDIGHSLATSTDSLEVKSKPEDVLVTSTDSLEVTTKSRCDVASDSLDTDRVESPRSSYDVDEELKNIASDRDDRLSPHHLMLSSPDSLEATSSAGTHATYQNETDSAMSSSFTSAGSNTMVSSTENLENLENIVTNYSNWLDGNPYMTEVVYNVSEKSYVTTERVTETPTDVKITTHGQDAKKLYEKDMAAFKPGEYYSETQEIDSEGNIHIKKVIESRAVVTSEKIQNSEKIILDPEQYRSEISVEHFTTRSQQTRIESSMTSETNVRHEQKEVSGNTTDKTKS